MCVCTVDREIFVCRNFRLLNFRQVIFSSLGTLTKSTHSGLPQRWCSIFLLRELRTLKDFPTKALSLHSRKRLRKKKSFCKIQGFVAIHKSFHHKLLGHGAFWVPTWCLLGHGVFWVPTWCLLGHGVFWGMVSFGALCLLGPYKVSFGAWCLLGPYMVSFGAWCLLGPYKVRGVFSKLNVQKKVALQVQYQPDQVICGWDLSGRGSTPQATSRAKILQTLH